MTSASVLLRRLTTRTSLAASVLVIAALGLTLTVVSGRIYRDHAIERERASLAELVRGDVERTQREIDSQTHAWVRFVAEQSVATEALPAAPPQLAAKLLDALSERYAAANPALVAVALYDAEFRLLARHNLSSAAIEAGDRALSCAYLRLPTARARVGVSRVATAGYCFNEDRLYYSVYVPIERPLPGYLEAVTDAVSVWAAREQALGLPLRVVLGPDTLLYQSSAWPAAGAVDNAMIAAYSFEVPARGPLALEVAKDETAFYTKLEQTRYAVFFAAAAATLLVVLIVLAFLEKTLISPMRALANELRNLNGDESQLGRRIQVSGNADVTELATRFNEMTQRLEGLYENLERMAFTDPLTQLPNRSLLLDRVEQAITSARHEGKTFALFIMDLDRFKEINDTLGHDVGDLLLQQVAIRLRAKLRDTDTIARMGGDEFGVLLPTETAKQAETAARMLLQSLRAPFMIETHHLDVRISIGVALYPDHGVDAHTLIQRADVAMYAAKQAGGGHMFYDPQMDRHHPAQLTLMGELRQAVDHEQFVLYYQPKIGLKTNRVVGVEALVRWRHPSGQLVMPETFIPLLEQTGLIRNLTGWVTHEALRMARELRERGFELPIAVNISARDLHNSGLAEELAEQLAVHQARAQWLELEITESAVMADINGAMSLLAQLAGMGFKLVIDDFGTGYSSLAYLKRLPVHAVKIDKSFVMGMVKDENDAAIVYTSIDLSHNLGLQVVAEGVDDESVLFRLRARGCDAAQGIYLSRPLPPADLMDWLAKSTWGLRAKAVS